ncbi:hypothetical protein RHGRI_008942 [Rhododendron griersonianum]|uniref:Uncharacterized protein n=1 Tax=Rhododendron griersonianum TaxID=479676 RepID=A0AAV6L5H4_9ERIC|nr:hypothetical protein RHGRI_008942 [Rhododendron griersonianum]
MWWWWSEEMGKRGKCGGGLAETPQRKRREMIKMADDQHGVSFHQFCLDNAQTFWQISVNGHPVALSNVPLLILRKILNVVKSCHDNDMSSGNLLDNILVVNNEDVVLAGGPVPLDLVNPRLTMHNDLVAVRNLVLRAVYITTPLFLPDAVRSFNNLFALLTPFYQLGFDLRRIEFYLFNSPLFLDVMGKYLLFRKILNLAEYQGGLLFFGTVDVTGIGNWLPYVHNQLLTLVRDHRGGVNLLRYQTPRGSILFFRNALGHLNGPLFISDAHAMTILEDELPWVMPRLFSALVRGMDITPTCIQICGMTLEAYLRAPISVFA